MAPLQGTLAEALRRERAVLGWTVSELRAQAHGSAEWEAHYRAHPGFHMSLALLMGLALGLASGRHERSMTAAGQVVRTTSDMLTSLAAAAAVDLVEEFLPGFRDEFARGDGQ